MTTKTQATIEDLYRVPENGKAEIVNGELILMPPTGDMLSRAAFNIAFSLREFARGKNIGRAYPDNIIQVIKLICLTAILSVQMLPFIKVNLPA